MQFAGFLPYTCGCMHLLQRVSRDVAPQLLTPHPLPSLHQVYKPRGAFNVVLWVIDISMLLVCACATVGAVRGIIKSWSSYKIFGD